MPDLIAAEIQVPVKKTFDDIYRMAKALRTEKNPTDGYKMESKEYRRPSWQAMEKNSLCWLKDTKEQPMVEAPDEEGKIHSMPQACQCHRENQVPCPLGEVPSERNINVIPEPERKADMPTPPELGKRRCQIRRGKISAEFDPKQQSGPPGYQGISEEICVDFGGKSVGSQETRKEIMLCGGVEIHFHQEAEIVSNHQLQKVSSQKQPDATIRGSRVQIGRAHV